MVRRLAVALAIVLAAPVFVEAARGTLGISFGNRGFAPGSVPEPELLAPVRPTVDLTGQETLEFRWRPFVGNVVKRRFYDFLLYKGRQQLARYLIFKQRLEPNTYSLVLKTEMFEDGEVYTWTLAQSYWGQKSDFAYSSFQVIKKTQPYETRKKGEGK